MKQVKRMMDKAWKLMYFVSEFFRDMLTFIRHNGYSPLESRNKKLFYKILIASCCTFTASSSSILRTVFS